MRLREWFTTACKRYDAIVARYDAVLPRWLRAILNTSDLLPRPKMRHAAERRMSIRGNETVL